MKTFLLILFVIFSFTSCSSKSEPLDSVKKVVLKKYFNSWPNIITCSNDTKLNCKNKTNVNKSESRS